MKYILGREQRELLAQYAWSNTLLAFDVDGTLAPIVEDPDAAKLAATTRRLLAKVAAAYPTAVISGRARDDVAARVEGIPLVAIIGNHGAEPTAEMNQLSTRVRSWVEILSERVSTVKGIEVEDKRYSVAVHYRRARSRRTAREAIETVAHSLGSDARIVGGKCVVNVVPVDAPHKGLGLQRLRDQLKLDRAVYVGDDLTDEDVFALDDHAVLGIRVGRSERSRAAYFIRRQVEIDELLERFADLRTGRPDVQRAEYL